MSDDTVRRYQHRARLSDMVIGQPAPMPTGEYVLASDYDALRMQARERAEQLLTDLIQLVAIEGGYFSDTDKARSIATAALADAERGAYENAAKVCEVEALIDDERGYYGKEMAKAIRAKATE